MAAIERSNIIQLIGKDKRKYSSCIISCYSFDFSFFEERVIPALRMVGVRNINVFLDGRMMDEATENLSGREFRAAKSYSITKIYPESSGVFHPKMMLLTGPKQGLLIIGSGNLTSSGINTNDEIWGAFQLGGIDSKNAPVFAQAWQYLMNISEKASGFNKVKIDWLAKRALWVNDLQKLNTDGFIELSDKQELQFLANNIDRSIYQKLFNLLSAETIKSVEIVSPYFDKRGLFISILRSDLGVEDLICITDPEHGTLPNNLSQSEKKRIQFYKWTDCIGESGKDEHVRLHAKMIRFETDGKYEYLLLGSPNASIQAFGSGEKQATNEEAAILLRRKTGSNYFLDLGIKHTKAKPIDITDSAYVKKDIERKETQNYLTRISYTERNGDKLTVILTKAMNKDAIIVVSDHDSLEIDRLELQSGLEFCDTKLEKPGMPYKVHLELDDKRVSNFCLIHDVASLAKSNPDPRQAELNELFDDLETNPNSDAYVEILKYMDYSWADSEADISSTQHTGAVAKKKSQTELKKEYRQLSEQEFNKLQAKQSVHAELLNHPNCRFADLLNLMSSGLGSTNEEITEIVEEQFSEEVEEMQTGAGEEIKVQKSTRILGRAEKKAFNKHIDKIHKAFHQKLRKMYNTNLLSDAPTESLSLMQLANISIIIDLYFLFAGRKYSFSKKEFSIRFKKEFSDKIKGIERGYKLRKLDKLDRDIQSLVFYEINVEDFERLRQSVIELDPSLWYKQEEYTVREYEASYFYETESSDYKTRGIKNDLVDLLGAFLICASSKAGYKEYPYDVLNDKMTAYRENIFFKATYEILNLHWREKEEVLKTILLLDLLRFVCPERILDGNVEDIKEKLTEINLRSSYHSPFYKENLDAYLNVLYPMYKDWKNLFCKLETKKQLIRYLSDLSGGNIIYNTSLGFSEILSIGDGILQLIKPGVERDDKDRPMLVIKNSRKQFVTFS